MICKHYAKNKLQRNQECLEYWKYVREGGQRRSFWGSVIRTENWRILRRIMQWYKRKTFQAEETSTKALCPTNSDPCPWCSPCLTPALLRFSAPLPGPRVLELALLSKCCNLGTRYHWSLISVGITFYLDSVLFFLYSKLQTPCLNFTHFSSYTILLQIPKNAHF